MAADRQGSDAELSGQIEQMWSGAQVQLQQLKQAIEQAQKLGRAHESLQRRRGEREVALQKLGESFYKLVQSGQVDVPAALKRAVTEVRLKDEALVREQSDISAMLEEAEEVAAKPVRRPAMKQKSRTK